MKQYKITYITQINGNRTNSQKYDRMQNYITQHIRSAVTAKRDDIRVCMSINLAHPVSTAVVEGRVRAALAATT